MTPIAGDSRWRGVFALTLLLNAALLFAIEPLVARMLLPRVGGAAAVWSTCLVFFQITLVGGYFYAHLSTRRLSLGAQIVVHGVLLALAALVLPIDAHAGLPPATSNPVPWLLRSLAMTVGPPFLVLAATTPLVQSWFGRARPAANAYSLYAAANLGSFIGLLAYPLGLEPLLDVDAQSRLWAAGYGVAAAAILGCGIACWRSAGERTWAPPVATSSSPPGAILHWVILASLPAALTISVTSYIATDIAAIPLVWVVPLSLYLLTLVVAFARSASGQLPRLVVPFAVILPVAGMLADSTRPAWVHAPVHLLAFFVVSLACHQALARSRPMHDRLPEFYLWLALGGAAGGIFAALVAPLVFRSPLEYPIGLLIACYAGTRRERSARLGLGDAAAPILASILVLALASVAAWLGWVSSAFGTRALVFGPGLIVAGLVSARPRTFVLTLGAMFIVGGPATGVARQTLAVVRSFYGVHRVQFDDSSRFHVLLDGSTIHGIQAIDPSRRRECLGYYSGFGPAGQVFEALQQRPAWSGSPRIAVLGLGAGTLACYTRAGERWTFFEIDPAVAALARSPRYFTYLTDATAPVAIVIGDARLSLAQSPTEQTYDLIVVDVFSSDAIPVHLLTREAMRIYLDHLAPGGVVLVHISNLYLDLRPVVGAVAHDAGLVALANNHEVSSMAATQGVFASEWAVLARDRADLGTLADEPQWQPIPATDSKIWTDQHASLVSVFKLRR